MGDVHCHAGQISVFVDIDRVEEQRLVAAAAVNVPVIALKERILDLKALKQVNPALPSHVWGSVRLLPVVETIALRHVGHMGRRVWMPSQKPYADLPAEIAIVSRDLGAFGADGPTMLVVDLGQALLKVVPVPPERTANSE
ncbi:uncharacterized protein LOC62_07G009788 [Vanrija pseudolonga]|uniref:Uncharacterized protein n=1 Tax=Vanrija pseudolonga TaxID=143232 RepID=A0AAF1BMI9_9TREE|nr:hypothetical protein LOC62_07G009788 [Vanrija pseudolonga]